jgi:phage shock protein PspC (stress-responsive transcriptional regulator)
MTIKKSITINIAQTLIRIDEDAYEKLHAYLESVETYFTDAEDAGEIISDIEARIAELLMEKTTSAHPSISVDDVSSVIDAMGTPDDFDDTGTASAQTDDVNTHNSTANNTDKAQRRLFRDEDNAMIAGVCAGIAAYTGVDVTFIRIIFLILLFVNGIGILAYIICWITMPTAKTVAEKMQMRGEPVTIESMKARAEEWSRSDNVKQAQVKIETGAKQFASSVQDVGQRFGKDVERVSRKIVPVIMRVIGILLLCIVSALLLCVLCICMAIALGLLNSVLPNTLFAAMPLLHQWIFGMSIALLIALPVLSLFVSSIQMVRQPKGNHRLFPAWLSILCVSLWWVALCVAGTFFVKYAEPAVQQWDIWEQQVEEFDGIEVESESIQRDDDYRSPAVPRLNE